MTDQEIIARRLPASRLGGRHLRPEDIVSHMVAMQAQEYAMAKWAIGLRLPGLKDADVEKTMGIRIATDVHTLSLLDDDYNRDFMEAADILFMSHEALPCAPEDGARKILEVYGNEIIVIGLGKEGSLPSVKSDHFLERIPACFTRTVQNTLGAGDAFFSAFVHFYTRDRNPYEAVRKATVFASYKIGEKTASEGFLSEAQLEDLHQEVLKRS